MNRWVQCLALALLLGQQAYGAGSSLAWKLPSVGTEAFLGDDGGGVETATLCNTADHYRKWFNLQNPSGCRTFPHGLRVVIKDVLSDPRKDMVGGLLLPIAKVYIPSKKYTGYLRLWFGVHPEIPDGSTVYLDGDGDFLAPSQESDLDTGIKLSGKITAKIIKYDPATEWRDLYVVITEGVGKGEKGWLFSMHAKGDDGEQIDQFANSMISVEH